MTAVSVDSAASVVHLGVYLGIGTRDETRATAGMLHVMKNAWLVITYNGTRFLIPEEVRIRSAREAEGVHVKMEIYRTIDN